MRTASAILLLATVAATRTASAAEAAWPGWRGPNQNGVVSSAKPPVEFSPDKNLLWKVDLPGRACSTPVIAGGKIFVSTPIDDLDGVIAYSTDGKELWRKTLGKARSGRGQRVGSSANSSPVTDGETVIAYFKSGMLAGFSLTGEKLWTLNIFEKYGADKLWWDVGTSPVLTSKGVVIAVMQTDGPSHMVCLDKKTGKEIWKVDRNFDTAKESGDSYTTPHVVEVDGKETIVVWGADHLTGHSVEDGSVYWTCAGFNPEKKGMWRVIASAVVTDGYAVVPFARGDQLAGVKLGGKGDITKEGMVWKKDGLGTDAATPAAADGKVYLLTDRGKDRGDVACVEAATGKVLWKSTLPKGAQTYYSSPVIAGDIMLIPREDGVVFSAKITDKGLKDITANEIGQNMFASPVVADGMLLLRGDHQLMAFSNK